MLKLSGERSEPGFFGAAGENFVDFEVRNASFQADLRLLDFERPLWRDLTLRKIDRERPSEETVSVKTPWHTPYGD